MILIIFEKISAMSNLYVLRVLEFIEEKIEK